MTLTVLESEVLLTQRALAAAHITAGPHAAVIYERFAFTATRFWAIHHHALTNPSAPAFDPTEHARCTRLRNLRTAHRTTRRTP